MSRRPQYYAARAQIAKALGHPSRLLMLDALKAGDKCVCELTALVGSDQSTVSKHLSVLKQAGLVTDRREGVMIYYHLECPCIEGFFSCLESTLQNRLEAAQRMLAP